MTTATLGQVQYLQYDQTVISLDSAPVIGHRIN